MSENVVSNIKEKIGKSVLDQLEQRQPPELKIITRTIDNVFFDATNQLLRLGEKTFTRKLKDLSGIRPFTQTVLIANSITKSLQENQSVSKRDVFYNNNFTIPGSKREMFDSQSECDVILQDIEVLTGTLREDMGIVADPKGTLVGPIRLKSGEDIIDCSKLGKGSWSIPSTVGDIQFVQNTARFLLVVEKGTVFQRLNSTRWWEQQNCLLVSGGGQPDRGTRQMVKRLSEELNLPSYILTDSDPYGWHIFSVYKCGSMSLAYESERLSSPGVKFLGISSSDVFRYRIPENALIKAEEADLKRAKEMLKYQWFSSDFWQRELNLFLQKKVKCEIEGLSRHGYRFLAETYLPEKLGSVITAS